MIQDDKREKELIALLGLIQNPNRKRQDIDASLDIGPKRINFELKSTTVGAISSASPLTIEHINKWRTYHWIFGIYDKNSEKLKYCVYASPDMMKNWLDGLEKDINRGLLLSHALAEKVDFPMLFMIFGKKDFYTLRELRKVFKKLYSKKQYSDLRNHKHGYTPDRALEMFRKHNLAYLIKGSWLNNPKIRKEYYKDFPKIKNNWKDNIKRIIKEHI